MAVTQDDVVRAAVELLDEGGLPALTLRAVAARLGVRAPTLYWHVRNKRHLLDLVCDHVVGDYLPPGTETPREGQPVWEWLAERCRAQRVALLSHRDAAQVVAGNRPTEAALPTIERTLGVLVGAGLRPGEAVRVLSAIGSFLIGDALETESNRQRPPDPPGGGWAADLPLTAAAGADMGNDDDRFEEGLCLLLDGLRVRLESRAMAEKRR